MEPLGSPDPTLNPKPKTLNRAYAYVLHGSLKPDPSH